jgi:hypothetical protein
MDVVRLTWWHYPDKCGSGYEWGPCPVTRSWVACDCGPAQAAQDREPGHIVACCQAPGCWSAWYQPGHEPADRA